MERMENNMLKWYGHVVRMKENRWPKRIMTWSPGGGRRRGGRPEVKWEKKIERVMKRKNLISDDAINRKLWRLKTSNRWITGKQIDLIDIYFCNYWLWSWILQEFEIITNKVQGVYLQIKYREFLLSCPRARQLYRIESLHPPGHLVTGLMLRETKKKQTPWVGLI